MAKTNRFQLEMEDGILVNTLRELKEHFSLEKVQDYARNGQLAEWLDARYEEELADEVRALDEYRADFAERLCKLFGVEYSAAVEDSEEAAVCREKRERLMAYGADAKFFEVLDNIAFTQDDLYDLLDKDITSIYLCGEEFEIPINRRGTAYVGVNEPTVIIHSKKLIDWEERDISFTDVKFDEEYQALVLKNAPCGAPKEGLETLTIDDDLTVHRGEEKVFSSKELYLNSNIECDGSLFFEQSLIHIGDESRISCHGAIRFVNCTLLYTREYSTGGEIVIESSSEFELINCIVEAEEEVENKCEYSDERKVLFYIYGNNYSSGQPKNKYNISRCCFIDCASTFTAEDHTGTLHFDNCSIVNPGRWFVYTDNYTDYIEMDTTVITFNEQLLYSEYTRPVVKAKMLTLRNCKFNGNNSDEGVWFYQGKETSSYHNTSRKT